MTSSIFAPNFSFAAPPVSLPSPPRPRPRFLPFTARHERRDPPRTSGEKSLRNWPFAGPNDGGVLTTILADCLAFGHSAVAETAKVSAV